MTRDEQWGVVRRVVLLMIPLGALGGVLPGLLIGGADPRSAATGAMIGALVGGGMAGFETAWAVGLFPRRWREAPFLVVLLTRSLAWLAIISVGVAVPLLTVSQVTAEELFSPLVGWSIGISFLLALLFNFVAQVNRLLGPRVLVRLILGRYHRPREETRVFLLVDLQDSTSIAERLGNAQYHGFLKRFISDVSAGVLRHGAEVHRYVGDEVILTWDETKGLKDASCVKSVFAIRDTIDLASDEYRQEFGIVPEFRAALHLGQVMTGDIGTVKHEIVYLGDTLNTAARIEEACREFQRPFLASADVVSALELPDDTKAMSIGEVGLRGSARPVELFAISRSS